MCVCITESLCCTPKTNTHCKSTILQFLKWLKNLSSCSSLKLVNLLLTEPFKVCSACAWGWQETSALRFLLNVPVFLVPNCVFLLFRSENLQNFYQLQSFYAAPISACPQTKRNAVLAHSSPFPPPKDLRPSQTCPISFTSEAFVCCNLYFMYLYFAHNL